MPEDEKRVSLVFDNDWFGIYVDGERKFECDKDFVGHEMMDAMKTLAPDASYLNLAGTPSQDFDGFPETLEELVTQ